MKTAEGTSVRLSWNGDEAKRVDCSGKTLGGLQSET